MEKVQQALEEDIKKALQEFVGAPNTEEGRKSAVDKLNKFFEDFLNDNEDVLKDKRS